MTEYSIILNSLGKTSRKFHFYVKDNDRDQLDSAETEPVNHLMSAKKSEKHNVKLNVEMIHVIKVVEIK